MGLVFLFIFVVVVVVVVVVLLLLLLLLLLHLLCTTLSSFSLEFLCEKASSGITVDPATVAFHNEFCKFNKKPASVFYFLKCGKTTVRRKVKPEWNGEKVARTPENSKAEVAKVVAMLKKEKPEFVFFHINYQDADDNNRDVSCILLLFWRASATGSTMKNMKLSTSTSAIRNSLTNISYLEAESKGDLAWEHIVAKCKAKK